MKYKIKGKYLVEGTFWVIFFEPLYTFFQQIILYQIISYSSLVNSRSYINRFEVGKKHIIISNEENHFVSFFRSCKNLLGEEKKYYMSGI